MTVTKDGPKVFVKMPVPLWPHQRFWLLLGGKLEILYYFDPPYDPAPFLADVKRSARAWAVFHPLKHFLECRGCRQRFFSGEAMNHDGMLVDQRSRRERVRELGGVR